MIAISDHIWSIEEIAKFTNQTSPTTFPLVCSMEYVIQVAKTNLVFSSIMSCNQTFWPPILNNGFIGNPRITSISMVVPELLNGTLTDWQCLQTTSMFWFTLDFDFPSFTSFYIFCLYKFECVGGSLLKSSLHRSLLQLGWNQIPHTTFQGSEVGQTFHSILYRYTVSSPVKGHQ